jgi:hypothetical protein
MEVFVHRMLRSPSLLLLALLSASCAKRPVASDPATSPGASTAAEVVDVNRNVPLSRFRADVRASTEGGECDTRAIPGLGRQVGIAFPNRLNPIRRVWLTYDETNTLISYTEERGDLVRKVVGPDGGPPRRGQPVTRLPPEGRQTTIDINLRSQVGLAENLGGNKPPVSTAGKADEMMGAGNLGRPRAMVEMITARCPR